MSSHYALPFLALASLLLVSCQSGTDYSDLFVDSSLSVLGEEIADDSNNSIIPREVYLLDDKYFVLDADVTFRGYVLFSYQIIPIFGSNMDLNKTIAENEKDLFYGPNSIQANIAFYFVGATSFDENTTYSINFNIIIDGYKKSYFQFMGSQVGHKSSD